MTNKSPFTDAEITQFKAELFRQTLRPECTNGGRYVHCMGAYLSQRDGEAASEAEADREARMVAELERKGYKVTKE